MLAADSDAEPASEVCECGPGDLWASHAEESGGAGRERGDFEEEQRQWCAVLEECPGDLGALELGAAPHRTDRTDRTDQYDQTRHPAGGLFLSIPK